MITKDLLAAVTTIAKEAGEVIMAVYATNFAVANKQDASPVTEADQKAEEVILDALARLTPDVPIVSEEAASTLQAPLPQQQNRFWLVDPLDGTKEFINRNGEFTVNIALIEAGQPVLGVVLAPALGRLFVGARGLGAFLDDAQGRRAIHSRSVPNEGLTVVASRSHGDAEALDRLLAGRPIARLVSAGSSLKLCLVAAGEADIYPRLGRTMEWDIAAGHAVLAAAGGRVETLSQVALSYNKPGFENPHFAAIGDPQFTL